MSLTQNIYDDRLLKILYGDSTYQKGYDYYINNRVVFAEVSEDFSNIQINAEIRGSKEQLYSVLIELKRNEALELKSIASHCTCPLINNCKHVLAVLLFVKDQMEGGKGVVHPIEHQSQSSSLSEWGKLLGKLQETQENKETKSERNLGFILKRKLYAICELKCGEMRRLKSGRFSTPARISSYTLKEKFHLEDLKILMNLMSSRSMVDSYMRHDLDGGILSIDSLRYFSGFEQVVETHLCFLEQDMKTPLKLGSPRLLSLFWELQEQNSYQLIPSVQDEKPCCLLFLDRCWYVDPQTNTCGYVETQLPIEILKKVFEQNITLPIEELPEFKKQQKQQSILKELPLPPDFPCQILKSEPHPCLKLSGQESYYSTRFKNPQIALSFRYNSSYVSIDNEKHKFHVIEDQTHYIIERDIEKETQYLSQLCQFPIENFESFYDYRHRRSQAYSFSDMHHKKALNHLHQLEKSGWQIEVDRDFPYEWFTEIDQLYVDMHTKNQNNNWFDLEMGILVDGEKKDLSVALTQLLERDFSTLQAIQAIDPDQQIIIALADGSKYSIVGSRLKKILKVLFELYDKKSKQLGTTSYTVHEIDDWGKELDDLVHWKKSDELNKALARIQSMQNPCEHELPQTLNATLRPYQKKGYQWLQQLRQNAFGGILADDMGLGKTIQTLSLLLAEKETGRATGPSLIVAPTSLMGNWEHEAKRFAPSLKILILHGSERRESFQSIQDYDLVFTTYPLVTRDQEVLLSEKFYYVVLDEAQYIKNPLAKAFQVLCQLSAQHRLCLSGTPIQNNLGEIWSLFHFLNKGLFGSRKHFTQYFRNPIEKEGCVQAQAKLAKRASPFLLRRSKGDVALDLPPKNEIIKYISFEESQRDLYETIRISMLEKVRSIVHEKGLAKSQIIILDALLKMRQACCDPSLIKMDTSAFNAHSAKLEYLLDLLEDLRQKKHKVLLFSSFTSMLEIIEERLVKNKHSYVKLTGQTQNRQEVIETFKTQDISVFLISLKAGGTGLNLTEADTVIIYDPWWNPAAEAQASDRAHRIGQDKPVFVYKLIAEKTIEEKILELQKKKANLAQNLYLAQDSGKLSLSLEDLEELFKPF